MPSKLETWLRMHLKTHDGKSELLFVNRDGRPLAANKQTHSIVGKDWQFAERPASLLEFCRNALDDLDSFVKQNLSVSP